MIIVFVFLAYLVLVAAVTAGLVALSRRLCREGDREREAAEFAAGLLARSGRASAAFATGQVVREASERSEP